MISVILPTYNESGNIRELILRTSKSLRKNFEIIVVDDNSPDGTGMVVQKMQKNRPYLRLIVRQKKQGLPSALITGIKESAGEIISFFDCDLSMPPEKLPEMISLLGRNDIVNGSRFTKEGRDNRSLGYAKFFSRLINKTAQIFLGSEITDYTSGFLVAKRKAVEGICLEGDHGSFYIGFLCEAKKKGLKITEVPYTFSPRQNGQSKIAGLGSYSEACFIYFRKFLKLTAMLYWSCIKKNLPSNNVS